MMSDLVPVSVTEEVAVFMYRSIRLTFTVSETSRLLTAVFDNDPTRPHTAADWLHAEEIRELLGKLKIPGEEYKITCLIADMTAFNRQKKLFTEREN